MSIKPYFQSKDTHNIKLDKLKATAKLDKLEATAKLDKLEVTTKLDKLEAAVKLDKLKAPLLTLKVPQKPIEPAKPTVKYS